MDSQEFSLWLAYDQLDLLPDPWRQTGKLCQVLAATWGKKSEIEDWIPRPKPVRIVSGEEGRAYFQGMKARHAQFEKNKASAGVGLK